tara:strand:- start:992 stop:1408 length:417 start_codon:yes stop_codon:yes gene_type:complete
MFGLVAFFFKLFFSVFFAVLFSHFIIEEDSDSLNVIFFSILGCSSGYIFNSGSGEFDLISYSIIISVLMFLAFNFFNIKSENKNILLAFPVLISFMIGISMIFQSVILLGFLYIARNNLFDIYSPERQDISDSKIEVD